MIFHFTKEKNTRKATVKTTVENSIVDFIAKNPKTTLSDIASQIGKSIRAVERAAAKLKQEGKINFVGPKKSGHWEIVKQKEDF